MRLFILEMKRILKTRTTWVLIAAALLLTLLCAWLPVSFQEVLTEDANGNEIRLKGPDAIAYFHEHAILQGELQADTIMEAVAARQNIYKEYNSEYGENIPELEFYKRLWPYADVSRCSLEVMSDSETGYVKTYPEINVEDLRNYYDLLDPRLAFVLRVDNYENAAAIKAGQEKFQKVRKPYTYYYGIDRDNMDYEVLLILSLTLICAFICSTIFSSDSQTGASAIQYCTKHGTLYLAICKIAAGGLICCALFTVCVSLFIELTALFFGKQSLLTSVQALYSVITLIPWNIGEMMWGILRYTLLFLGCTITFTFLLSALSRKNANAVCIALLSVILPMISYIALPEKLENWVQCILPSGGIGTSNSILYMLTQFNFIPVGSAAFWNVDVILVISAIEIPVFIALTLLTAQRKAIGKM